MTLTLGSRTCATPILDWHHLTMKLTVLGQYGKGLVQLSLSRFLSGM